jgi:trimeric autotransporter adhesin
MGLGRRLFTFAACCAWALVEVLAGAQAPQPSGPSQPAQTGARCRVEGHVRSGSVPLPGASIVVEVGDALKATTSTDVDGKYTIAFSPNATYHISADLTAFARVDRDLVLAAPPCDTTVDFALTLKPRRDPLTAAAQTPDVNQAAQRGLAPQAQSAGEPVSEQPAAAPGGPDLPGQSRPARAGRGRGAQGGQGGQRFQTLNVQADANGVAALDVAAPEDADEIARLLPPGFSAQSAQADAITINGSADATSLDRGLLNDRQQAIRLGAFDPATGQFADGGLAGGQGPGGVGGQGDGGGRGGRGGGPGRGGGRGGLNIGGRAARGQSPYQGSVTYTFGGSALNASPYQLRPEVAPTQPLYAANTFGGTFGGPLKIPGLYADTNRRTNFQLNYTGNQSNNVFDQYATVPTNAMRQGDFSGSPIQLIDPTTGQPFAGNQIPSSRINPGAATLLGFIPAPNLPGTLQNYHVSTTTHSSSDAVSVRLTQNLSRTVTPGGRGGFGRGGGGGGFGGGGGGFGGGGGRGGQGTRGTNIVLNAQLQYRRNETESPSVFSSLGSHTINTSVAAPISLNVQKGRSVHNVTVNFTHANTQTTNAFSGVDNVAGAAGIKYPGLAAPDPLNWGVPNLSFTNFTSVRMPAAGLRNDDRFTLGYTWRHPTPKHQLRFGADYRLDNSIAQINSNARGSYTFTGLYSSGGARSTSPSYSDFADFLLGAPQLATLQVGGLSHLRQHAFDAFVEDNWQKTAKLTFNLGLRYELWLPYAEINGQMSNLSLLNGSNLTGANFTAAVPVFPGQTGIPAGLLKADPNNIGPRLGFAYRVEKNTTLRGGYSITYNSSSYASIARQLVAQPPFAETETVTGTPTGPLAFADALLSSTSGTTNNWGVSPDYALGTIQMWNASVTRNLTPNWAVTASYTGTKGTNLDLLNAPNRGPLGLLVPDVQPFTFESSGGNSIMNAGSFQVRRRLAGGVSGGATYTLEKSTDDVPSLGAGAVVAQNAQNLGAEWAVSNFDRRNQLSADLGLELPFGPNRHWLKNGGLLAGILGEWTLTMTLTAQSGTPLTARVIGAATDVAQGTNGALRANYTGAPIQLSNPLVDEFFNNTTGATAAFTAPAPGQFGDSARNLIIGPGVRQLNGALTRDVRIGGNRSVTLGINALNLLNTVQWQSVDTNVNSPTFGQVLSARPMRTMTASIRVRF